MKWHHSKKELRKIYETAEIPYGQIGMLLLIIAIVIMWLLGIKPA